MNSILEVDSLGPASTVKVRKMHQIGRGVKPGKGVAAVIDHDPSMFKLRADFDITLMARITVRQAFTNLDAVMEGLRKAGLHHIPGRWRAA